MSDFGVMLVLKIVVYQSKHLDYQNVAGIEHEYFLSNTLFFRPTLTKTLSV